MSSSPNIFSIILTAVLSILYIFILPISLILSPTIEYLSHPENINNVIDNSDFEKQLLTKVGRQIIQKNIDSILPISIVMTEQEIEKLLITEDLISWTTTTRRELINRTYTTLEDGTSLSFKPEYKGAPNILIEIIAQDSSPEYSNLPYCSEIATSPAEISDPTEQGCKPGIPYISEIFFHDPDTERSTLFPRFEITNTEAQTFSKLFSVMKKLPQVLIITSLALAFIIVSLSHSKKTGLVFIGLYTTISSTALLIFWKIAPNLVLQHNPITIETSGTAFEEFHNILNNIFTRIVQELLIQIGKKGTNIAIIATITGVSLLIVGLLLFRRKRHIHSTQTTSDIVQNQKVAVATKVS